jgi:competence protein ComEC
MDGGAVTTNRPGFTLQGPIYFTWLCAAWIAGLVAADWAAGALGFRAAGAWPAWVEFSASMVCAVAALAMMLKKHEHAARLWVVVGFFFTAMVFWSVRVDRQPADDVGQWAGSAPQLAEVVGRVVGPTRISSRDEGAFSKFSYTTPSTIAQLEVEAVRANGQMRPASGRLLMRVGEADYRLRDGERLRALGWLAAIDGPSNPGEFDFRKVMLDRGVKGRLSMPLRANWHCEPEADLTLGNAGAFGQRMTSGVTAMSRQSSDAVSASLRMGMPANPRELALLDALLLGRWDRNLGDLNQAFRRAGLTHLLAISGANLTILLGIVWAFARVLLGGPRRALLVVAAVLAVYLFMLPPQVPIVRAGIMAGVFCGAMLTGRIARAIDSLSLAALLVLIWRPNDLYDAGFQLSFGGVASLLLLTQPVAAWIAPRAMLRDSSEGTLWQRLWRWTAEYLAASLAVWAVTLPLLAFHFGVITPMGGVWTMLLSPVFSLLMGLGYFKMMIGLWLPSVGILMGWPVHVVTVFIAGTVEAVSAWRWSMIELRSPPAWPWAVATVATFWGACAGWFAHAGQSRRSVAVRTTLAAGLCICWLALPQFIGAGSHWAANGAHGVIAPAIVAAASTVPSLGNPTPALRIDTLAVGDGSCFLVRIPLNPGAAFTREHVLMFDCGSQQYLSVAEHSIVPALQRIGVTHIDTVMISHADLDHYCGLLDTMDHVPVARVLTTSQVLDNAAEHPDSAVAHLINGIESRAVPLSTIQRGWHKRIAGADLDVLWPPADFRPPKTNDTSIVLSTRTANRRVLLTGDIQVLAIRGLLKTGDDLRADIADLSHHGAFVDVSPAWVRAVNPAVVLQSCGNQREREDKWAGWFTDASPGRTPAAQSPRLPGTRRLMTARTGMCEVIVAEDGAVTWQSMRALRSIPTEP